MSDPFEDQAWARMGVAAALSKEYAGDQKSFLALLARTLEHMFPDETEVKTKGWIGPKTTVGVVVRFGDLEYGIDDPGHGPLVAWRKKIVRGIALKTESISIQECLDELGGAMEERAKVSAEGRNALAAMLGLQ